MEKVRLHLGCGYKPLPGFINVDINPEVNPDVVDDVLTLEHFNNNSVDLIYACHLFEHLSYKETHSTLSTWNRVLKSGGILRLAVPDMDAVMKLYLYSGDLKLIKHMVCGSQQNQWQFHKNIWDKPTLTEALENAGFENIEYWHWQCEMPHKYCDDYSQAYYPDYCKDVLLSNGKWVNMGGKLMSLNLQGTKI